MIKEVYIMDADENEDEDDVDANAFFMLIFQSLFILFLIFFN